MTGTKPCRTIFRNVPLRFLGGAGVLLVLLMGSLNAQQSAAARVYLPNPADEDWSFLRDPSQKSDFFDPIKYIPLGKEDRFLTISGEIRYRPEGFRIRGTEEIPSTRDNYFLQRYLVGVDFRMSSRFRIFTEVQSGIISGRLATPRPTDKNPLDLHQGFFEWSQMVQGKRQFKLKVGRQELSIGSSRLISASPGLNVKRSFDGVLLTYGSASWKINGAFAKLVSLKTGTFDDQPDHEQTFWGIAANRQSLGFKRGELGLYYLFVDRARAVYAQAEGRDLRHTLGVKWSGVGVRADLNYDAIFQWGEFIHAPIRAWAFSTETGFRPPGFPGSPRISLRADIASGDCDPDDPSLQSFNPLFPGNSYSGVIGLLGPTNLTDLTPAIIFVVKRRLVLGFEVPSYWRTSEKDGVYGTELRLLIPPKAGVGKYVGSNPGVIVDWQATRHLKFQSAITRFLSGSFLEQTFVAQGFGFYSVSILYRF